MITYVVVDANLTYKYIVPGAAHAPVRDLFTEWETADYKVLAPSIWAYEMTSIITKMVHVGEFTEKEGRLLLKKAAALPVQLVLPDDNLMMEAYHWTRRLQRMAAYDSFYLALAERLDCDFWTADRRLINAAAQSWIKSLPDA